MARVIFILNAHACTCAGQSFPSLAVQTVKVHGIEHPEMKGY
jgi:hypothetical protein